jgi:hypothetical protein
MGFIAPIPDLPTFDRNGKVRPNRMRRNSMLQQNWVPRGQFVDARIKSGHDDFA